jgi:hypothetical protein
MEHATGLTFAVESGAAAFLGAASAEPIERIAKPDRRKAQALIVFLRMKDGPAIPGCKVA